jgi:osmoprotectant transport system permease protein
VTALGAAQPWVEWSWIDRHTDDIRAALGEHLQLTVSAVALGLLLSVPLGVAAARWRRLLSPTLLVTGVLYSIPSLAFFTLLGPWTGYLTRTTVLVGLVAYTLLILTRNVVAGLDGVPDDVRDAAVGMGYSELRLLLRVDLPLALPAVLAGVRIATVSTVALVTIGFVNGHGGLGELILAGLRLGDRGRTPLVVGTVLCVALAITADLLLVGVQRLATPWSRGRR